MGCGCQEIRRLFSIRFGAINRRKCFISSDDGLIGLQGMYYFNWEYSIRSVGFNRSLIVSNMQIENWDATVNHIKQTKPIPSSSVPGTERSPEQSNSSIRSRLSAIKSIFRIHTYALNSIGFAADGIPNIGRIKIIIHLAIRWSDKGVSTYLLNSVKNGYCLIAQPRQV